MKEIPLRDLCRGRWQAILPAVGIDSRYLSGRHGPCPMCGGTDRFRFDDKEGAGTFICSGACGAGDGISLAMKFNHWDFKEAAAKLAPLAGAAPRTMTRKARSEQSLKDAMNRLWQSAGPITEGDTVARYLAGRGIRLTTLPATLRSLDRCRYQDREEPPSWHPAMLAKITAPSGKPVTIHRTYLTIDGRKASVASPRKIMEGKIDKGCAIRLSEPKPIMGIAEGIETAFSAAIIWGIPCWAAVNASMLAGWEPPQGTAEVIVFADHDEKFAGQAAAYSLAHKLAIRGVKVRVEMPPDPGTDWNDALLAERSAAA